MNKLLTVGYIAAFALVAGIFTAEARPEYAQKEGKACGYCHLSGGGGGARGFRGQYYGANGLSFGSFDEKREATIAALDSGGTGGATRAKVAYVGNISGPASKQIQLASLRGPVVVMFFDGAGDDAKAAAKVLHKLAVAYGRRVTVVGVTSGDQAKALKLTVDLGSQVRLLPDADLEATKKFGATLGLDMVVVSQRGDEFKKIGGFSKGNLEAAVAQVGSYGIAAPEGVDLSDAPATEKHGAKLGG